MRTFFIVCFAFLFYSGTVPTIQSEKYRIEGTIDKSFDGQRAIFSIMDDNREIILSDVFIINQGRFLFEGDEYLNNLSTIVIKDKDGVSTCPGLGLFLEQGTINVSFSEDKSYVGGTPLNDAYMEYQDSVRYFSTKISKIEPKWVTAIVIFPDTELGRLYYAYGDYHLNFVKRNITNSLGKALFVSYLDLLFPALTTYMNNNFRDNKKELDEIFAFVDEKTRVHPRFVSYIKKWEDPKGMRTFINSLLGTKVENFSFSASDGTTKQLSEFFGKKDYIFLDFWASENNSSMTSIPILKHIYKDYSDKLEIVSISLDTNRTSWSDTLSKHNMPWPQFADFKGFDSDIAKMYNIESVPFAFILDKQGVFLHAASAISLYYFMLSRSQP